MINLLGWNRFLSIAFVLIGLIVNLIRAGGPSCTVSEPRTSFLVLKKVTSLYEP